MNIISPLLRLAARTGMATRPTIASTCDSAAAIAFKQSLLTEPTAFGARKAGRKLHAIGRRLAPRYFMEISRPVWGPVFNRAFSSCILKQNPLTFGGDIARINLLTDFGWNGLKGDIFQALSFLNGWCHLARSCLILILSLWLKKATSSKNQHMSIKSMVEGVGRTKYLVGSVHAESFINRVHPCNLGCYIFPLKSCVRYIFSRLSVDRFGSNLVDFLPHPYWIPAKFQPNWSTDGWEMVCLTELLRAKYSNLN